MWVCVAILTEDVCGLVCGAIVYRKDFELWVRWSDEGVEGVGDDVLFVVGRDEDGYLGPISASMSDILKGWLAMAADVETSKE